VVARSPRAVLVEGGRSRYGRIRFACLYARGVRIFIDPMWVFPPLRVAGPYAAYASVSCDVDYCDTSVEVVDLRDELYGLSRRPDALRGGGDAEVPDVELKPDGAVAWIACPSLYGPAYGTIERCFRGSGREKRVYALDRRRARPRLLDASPRIDPESLTLRGSRLTWRKAGHLRAARLR
jgi:hypothetical protein